MFGETERQTITMENKEIRVAMLGFGGIAKAHKHAYDELKRDGYPVKLIAICDINPEQFKKAQAINLEGNPKYDLTGQKLYTNLDEMLKNEEFEMADICLPSYLHKEFTIKMLKAGKHVMCEKPMALSSSDCALMISTAKECGRKLMIGQCLRFEPLYLFLRDAISNNTFGKVRHAYFTRLSSMPRWGFDGWYRDTSRSGGAIMDLHIHDVDMVRFLFGEPETVSSIAYDTGSRWTVVNSRFLYNDDKIIVADASWNEAASTKFEMSYRVRFDNATVRLEGGKVTVYPDEGTPYDAELPRANRMAEEIKALASSVLENRENTANPPESAMMTVKLVEKLRESADMRGGAVRFI
jgi:predicted dehydrogenase